MRPSAAVEFAQLPHRAAGGSGVVVAIMPVSARVCGFQVAWHSRESATLARFCSLAESDPVKLIALRAGVNSPNALRFRLLSAHFPPQNHTLANNCRNSKQIR
jgi:hypothetical protein